MQFFHCFLALHYVPLITAGGPWKLETYSCPIRRSLPLTSTNKITDTTSKKKRKTTTTLESQDNTFTSPCGENIYKKKWQLEINARKVRSHHTVTVWKHFVVHTLFLTQKGCFFFFFWHFPVSAEETNSTVILFRAARSSRFCANIQCISIQ